MSTQASDRSLKVPFVAVPIGESGHSSTSAIAELGGGLAVFVLASVFLLASISMASLIVVAAYLNMGRM